MALPPILSNLPIIKNLGLDNARPSSEAKAAPLSADGQDTVEISEAALRKLEETQTLSSDNLDEVRSTAQETRDLIADSDLPLGLNPEFDQA